MTDKLNSMVLDQIKDLVTITDLNGMIRYVNQAQTEAFGLSKEEIIGKSVHVFGDNPETGITQDEIIAKTLKNGSWSGEVSNYGKDGREHILISKTQIVKNEKGEPIAMVGIAADISERKQSEQELRESEEKFRLLAESSAAGIFIHSGDKFQYVNGATSHNTGFSFDELYDMKFIDLVYDEDRVMVINAWKKRVSGGEVPGFYEVRLNKKGGGYIWAGISGTVITHKGKPSLIGTAFNITKRKKAESMQKTLYEQLLQSQKMESVGRLAGGVAHDFNNMLSVILGRSEIALKKADPDSELYRELNEIKTAAERSADLTAQLLAFARKQVVSPKVVSMDEEIQRVSGMLERLIGEDIVLDFRSSKDPRNIRIDPSQLGQILTNLFINAKDAGAKAISVFTETVEIGEDTDELNLEHGEYQVLKIKDNGSGMDEETKEKIFEPFFTTKQVGKGTGLGLSTIYGIVKQNQGVVRVTSEVGNGTEFIIMFPVVKEKKSEEKEAPERKEALQSGHTILLVEDEEAILEMTGEMLESFGFKVISARSPGEAINLSIETSDKIDILLTDVVMPEMNGRDMAEKIMTYHPDIKCVFMSGYTADVIASHGILDEGMNFLHKPFTMKKLRETLEQVAGKN